MSNAFITDFQHEYELEQERRLRTRVINYGIVSLVVALVALAARIMLLGGETLLPAAISIANSTFAFASFTYLLLYARRPGRDREEVLRRVSTVIIATSVVSTLITFALFWAERRLDHTFLFGAIQLLSLFLTHFIACIFLPWTWRESLRPMFPAMLATAICTLVMGIIAGGLSAYSIAGYLTFLCLCCLVVFPGIGIAVWKEHRFAQEFLLRRLGGRYGEMRRELSGAQRIHESLFPKPDQRGRLRFDYRYQPMRSIGGDYLYARFITTDDREEPQLLVLLLDVTGHGIPAALTVNRLYGELERLVAEQPGIMPTAVLRALNRYTFLTLADHSLFVTAICFRVDMARGTLHYANAGHPPAFLRDATGRMTELEPTAMVLGVMRDLDVEVEDARVGFHDGDTLIAYTDGATECRNSHGRMFNVEGFRAALEACKGDVQCISEVVMQAISAHRFGPPNDDTLIVEVTRVYAAAPANTKGANGMDEPNIHVKRRDPSEESRAGSV